MKNFSALFEYRPEKRTIRRIISNESRGRKEE